MIEYSLLLVALNRLIITLALLVLIKFIYNYFKVVRHFSKFPHVKGLCILGNLVDIKTNLLKSDEFAEQQLQIQFMQKHAQPVQKEGVFLAWIFWKPMVFLTNYQSIKLVLSSSKHLEKGDVYYFWHPQMGLGLLTQHVNKWRSRRKMLEPAFHIDNLRNSVDTVGKHADSLVKYFQGHVGTVLDVKELMPRAALDIVCDTVLGVSPDAINVPNSSYVRAIMNLKKRVITRLFNPHYWLDFIFYRAQIGKEYQKDIDTINAFSTQVINEWKSRAVKEKKMMNGNDLNGNSNGVTLSSKPAINGSACAHNPSEANSQVDDDDVFSSKKRPNLMDILLRHHLDDSITDESLKIDTIDMQDEVNTFIEAGHDPAGVVLTWIMQLLGCHTDIQERVYNEIKETLADVPFPYSWNDLANLTYTEAVIKECLRIRPPVPFLQRILDEDVTYGPYVIPKGECVTLSIFSLHQDPEIYPEPHVFNPDRFLPEQIKSIPPFAFLPFSGGKRGCLGQRFTYMELKMILSRLLLRYRFKSVKPFESIPYAFELVNRPKAPVEILIEQR
uniref:CYP391A1 n=1 Tax=Tetranychus cinnabarinus TaxID=93129 RepID=A0A140H4V8_TETCI|nr:CYP391A1 [Tetranychus cinnabarinus]